MSFKKSVITLMVAATLASSVYTPKAHAFGIVNILATGSLDYVGRPRTWGDMMLTTLCIVFLPVCILSDSTKDATISKEALLDNGYSVAQADAIVAGHEAFVSHMSANQLVVSQEGNMSKAELVEFISSVPGVTVEYVDFIRQEI